MVAGRASGQREKYGAFDHGRPVCASPIPRYLCQARRDALGSFVLCMSLSQNRCALLSDMHLTNRKGTLMSFALLDQIRSIFEGDPGVRKVADDPVLSAELLMLFRMILADGTVSESEMAAFRRICQEAFGIPEASIDSVVEYLNEFGYETNSSQAIAQFRDLDVERRKLLARHMAEIAKADSQLAGTEMQLLRRTLDLLDISPADVVKAEE
jgi:uncharacterized tellurite resistance protein B-like protein